MRVFAQNMIAIVNYGMGNLRSVHHALDMVGADVLVTTHPDDLRTAERIVLPGVGAFGECVQNLHASGLVEALTEEVLHKGKPLLGICLGMQVLARLGYEMGLHPGLGWVPAVVQRFEVEHLGLKIPHVGWNEVIPQRDTPLFHGMQRDLTFYFVHSYHLVARRACGHAGVMRLRAAVHRCHPARQHLRVSISSRKEPAKRSPSARELPGLESVSMLKKRIIPKLLLKNGRNVKGVQFTELRDVGHPVTNARIYDAQGADELLFLDITASAEHRAILYDIIARTAEEVFMPFCVGGGVRTVDDIRQLLLAGADKVAINTAAVETPQLIAQGARLFGAQCMVVSIDFRRHGQRCVVYTHGGTVATSSTCWSTPAAWSICGAGEILLDVDRPRRHDAGLRPRPDTRRRGDACRAGDRLGWGRNPAAPRGRDWSGMPRRSRSAACSISRTRARLKRAPSCASPVSTCVSAVPSRVAWERTG